MTLHASSLDPLYVAEAISHAQPPTIHACASMVLFCPIWTCPFIIHFISGYRRETTSEHKNPR